MTERLGQQLGSYRLIRLLGEGGFAEVYLGEHVYLKTQAAVKVLQVRITNDNLEGFLTEARTIASLKHPHIVRVLDFGVEGSTPFLVMDYASNGTLRQYHPRGTPVPLTSVLTYVRQVATALQYAHEHGIIHLDVKPANLLLDGEDRLLLADFGVSALLEGYTHASLHGYVGTPLYTAPEQWLEQPRAASDQYALAVTCYQLLTGRAPFTGNLYSIMHGHISTPPPPLRQFQPLIPSEVEEVILQALAKEPTNRYKDMQTFARAYRTGVESSSS